MKFLLYNTASGTKELFAPRLNDGSHQAQNKQYVTIYTCGPTVYGEQHIGNLRSFVNASLLANVIRKLLDMPVQHTLNITDVGHLTSDDDEGEDKMEKGARKHNMTARAVAEHYTDIFVQHLQLLNISFDNYPKATDYIDHQIAIVQSLSDAGYTYTIPDDGIYVDTSKTSVCQCLVSEEHTAGLQQGARVTNDQKRNKTDFAVRKFAPRDKQRDMVRDSPWGAGFPGRHIECSAMARATLGDFVDIHTGGVDHIAVHHTNEIIQSENTFTDGHQWVKYRMHNQFLTINNKKISKSLENCVYVNDILTKGYSIMDLKYFFYTGHYRSFMDFTRDSLDTASRTRQSLIRKLAIFGIHDIPSQRPHTQAMSYLIEPLLDDMHLPTLIARIHSLLSTLDKDDRDHYEVLTAIYRLDYHVLGLELYAQACEYITTTQPVHVPPHIEKMAQERRQAKEDKKFELADTLRQEIIDSGYNIIDTSSGRQITLHET